MTFAARVLQDNSQPIGSVILNNQPYYFFNSGFGAGYPTGGFSPTKTAFNPSKTVLAFATFAINQAGVSAIKWTDSGFSTLYVRPTSYPYQTSAPNLVSAGADVGFSPANNAIAFCIIGADVSTSTVAAYQWNDITGFGSRYVNVNTDPTFTTALTFNPSGNALAVAGLPAFVCAWSYSGGFGTRYTNPSTLNTLISYSVKFSITGAAIVFGLESSPNVGAWAFSGGFGAAYSAPSPAVSSSVRAIAFSPSNDAIAFALNTSPYFAVYEWNDSTGFGTKYTNPLVMPTSGNGRSVAFSDSGDYVIFGMSNGAVYVYAWDSVGGFGENLKGPQPPLVSSINSIAWDGA